MTDADFLARFLAADLQAADFNHRGHLRAAWLVLRAQPLEQAVSTVCDGILRLATRLGAPQKYHRTITEALVRWMAAQPLGTSFDAYADAHPQLLNDAWGLLLTYYSEPALSSAAARAGFVTPDRQGLPTAAC